MTELERLYWLTRARGVMHQLAVREVAGAMGMDTRSVVRSLTRAALDSRAPRACAGRINRERFAALVAEGLGEPEAARAAHEAARGKADR